MKIKLYTSPNCDACTKSKAALKEAGLEFEELSMLRPESAADLTRECAERGINAATIKSGPALVVDCAEVVWAGFECVDVIEEREWED